MGSDIARERFRDLGFRTSERDLVSEAEWFECYEGDDSSNISIYRPRVVVLH